MKPPIKIFIVFLLGLFCFSSSLSAQKSEAKKMAEAAEKAKKEVEDATKEVNDLFEEKDCSKFRNKDINDIQKAIRKAKEQAARARAAAEAATDAVANTNNRDRAEARGHEADARKAADDAEKALADALKKLPGITAADKIIEELGEVEDTGGNSDKQKIIKRLKDAAEKAGYKFPCDPDLVKKEVEDAFDNELRKYRGNGELKPWIEKLKEDFDQKELISFNPVDGGAYLSFGEYQSFYTVEILVGEEKTTDQGASHQSTTLFSEIQKQLYSDSGLFDEIAESLGGEFFFGDFTQPGPTINASRSNAKILGLNGQFKLAPHLLGEAGYSYGRSEITGWFPMFVFDHSNGETKTMEAVLSLREKTHTGRLGAGYQLGSKLVRTTLTGGLQYNRTVTSDAQTRISDLLIESSYSDTVASIGPYGKASIEAYPTARWFIKIAVIADLRKIRTGPEQKEAVLTPGLSIGTGFKIK